MNFKIFVAIVGVLVAAQVTQQCHLEDDDTQDLIELVLNKLLFSANAVLSKAAEDLQTLEDNKYNKSSIEAKVVPEVVEILKDIYAKGLGYMPFIQDLRNGATDEEEVVIDCISSMHGQIDDILKIAADDTSVFDNTLFITALKDVISQLNELMGKAQEQAGLLRNPCTCTCTCN